MVHPFQYFKEVTIIGKEIRELTKAEKRAIRSLVEKRCANYRDKEDFTGCLLLDGPCYMLQKEYCSNSLCRYFRNAVLPNDPALSQTNHLKAIITAELPMDLERKGEQSYQGDLRVRFLGLGNGSLQSLYDRTQGFYRRQIIITTKDKPADRMDDPYLAEKMCAELEGIFLWALEGLQRLIANNYRFTISDAARENMEEAISDGNNIVEFLQSEGYISFKADYEARSSDLYEVYKLWCRENAEHPFSMKTFITYLKQNADVYGMEYTNKINYQGSKVRGFVGLKIERQLFY